MDLKKIKHSEMSDVLTSQRNEQIGDKKVAILEQLR